MVDEAAPRRWEGEGEGMAEEQEPVKKVEEGEVLYVKPEENPCPQCGGPMVWVSGGPRCKHCGFKVSCCF